MPPFGRREAVQRLPGQRLGRRGHVRLLIGQGGEQAVRTGTGGNGAQVSVEERGTVQRIDGISTGINRRIWVRHVVDDEFDGGGHRLRVDVGRRDLDPPIGEFLGHVRAAPDPDFDDPFVAGQPVRDGLTWCLPHGEIFMDGTH